MPKLLRPFNRQPAEVRADGTAVAKALGGTWELKHHPQNSWGYSLVDDQGREIYVNLDKAPKRYHIGISWPQDNVSNYRHKPDAAVEDTIGLNFQRGSEAAANEIQRRLLPVLDAHWDATVQAAKQSNEDETHRQATVRYLAAKLGYNPSPQEISYGRVSKGNFHEIEVNHDGSAASIKTYNLPLKLVEKIIDLCQREQKSK